MSSPTVHRTTRNVGLALLAAVCSVGCDEPTPPVLALALDPQESCADHPGTAVVTFANAMVAERVAYHVGAPPNELSCDGVRTVEVLLLGPQSVTPLDGLQNLTNLQWLEVEDGNLTEADLGLIAALPNLHRLRITDNGLTDVSQFAGLDLDHVELVRNAITDIAPLGTLRFLGILNLSDNPVASLEGLAGLEYLRELRIDRAGLTTFDGLADLPDLVVLQVDDNAISDATALSGLTNLRRLFARNNSIAELPSLAAHSFLVSMNLEGNELVDVDWLEGNDSPYLEYIDLTDNAIADLSGLLTLERLQFLSLGGNDLTDISALSSFTTLTHLDLRDNAIEDIASLASHESLRRVWLKNNRVVDIASLESLTKLDFVDLSGNADLVDLQPLLDNPGMVGVPSGDPYDPYDAPFVNLAGTQVPCADVDTLRARHVSVAADCD